MLQPDGHRGRVADRIKALRGFLPDSLVENVKLYGLLSKSLHELPEKECLTHFDVAMYCVFEILEELKRKEHIRQMQRQLERVKT